MAKLYSGTPEPFFKKGDEVRPKPDGLYMGDPTGKRVVSYVGQTWVLYTHRGQENCMPRSEFEAEFEHVPDLVEVPRRGHHLVVDGRVIRAESVSVEGWCGSRRWTLTGTEPDGDVITRSKS